MKTTKLIIALVILSSIAANGQDYNNKHKNYIDIGYCVGAYSKSFMGGVYGAGGFFFKSFGKQSALDFRGKESYIVTPEKEAGQLSLTYRIYFTKGFYFGMGGAHNHEIAFTSFTEDPMGAIFATNKKVIHRTGLIGEVGYDFRSFIKKGGLGIYPVTNLSVAFMPGDSEPNPLINLSIGFRFGFKRLENL